jgi:hypothetical protein
MAEAVLIGAIPSPMRFDNLDALAGSDPTGKRPSVIPM